MVVLKVREAIDGPLEAKALREDESIVAGISLKIKLEDDSEKKTKTERGRKEDGMLEILVNPTSSAIFGLTRRITFSALPRLLVA